MWEDQFISHASSGLVITASRAGILNLAPRGEQTRSLDRGLILDTGLGLAHKLAAIYDTVKVDVWNIKCKRRMFILKYSGSQISSPTLEADQHGDCHVSRAGAGAGDL